MWEAIRSNQRKSWLLIGLMGVLLLALGAVIGASVEPQGGAPFGMAIAAGLWLVLWLVAAAGGDHLLLSSTGARRIEKHHAPQLWNLVEEMTIAAGLRQMPRVYVIDDDAPNAFAVGRRPERAAVAVTSGLLRRLNRDELQGVIAHEIGHVRNLDVRFMTTAAVMLGAIVLIAEVFLRALWYGGGRRMGRGERGGGQAQALLLLVAVALAILAPLLAQLLYFACSRRREYLADASAARFTRYPAGLANALKKIANHAGEQRNVSRVVAPMYIVNPLQSGVGLHLFSTHPPTEKRIRILLSMGDRAGLADYEAAYRQVHGQRARCLGARTLNADTSVPARAAGAATESPQDAVARARAVGDLTAALANYAFLSCPCGVRIKLPPDFKRPNVACPRCGRTHAVPTAVAVAATAAGVAAVTAAGGTTRDADVAPPPATPLRYVRTGRGWESFKCACGHPVQLSPGFSAPGVRCDKCGRQIEVVTRAP